MTVEEIRKEIDIIDDVTASLLVKRLSLIDQIAIAKQKENKSILDKKREDDILNRLSKDKTLEQKEFICRVYKEVFSASRDYQNSKK